MRNQKKGIVIDWEIRKAYYYIDTYVVATLEIQSDNFETFEEMTEMKADTIYLEMYKEIEEFKNEFNLI